MYFEMQICESPNQLNRLKLQLSHSKTSQFLGILLGLPQRGA